MSENGNYRPRKFFKTAGATGAALASTAVAAPAIAQSAPELKWPHGQLAKVARYPLWRSRSLREIRERGD